MERGAGTLRFPETWAGSEKTVPDDQGVGRPGAKLTHFTVGRSSPRRSRVPQSGGHRPAAGRLGLGRVPTRLWAACSARLDDRQQIR